MELELCIINGPGEGKNGENWLKETSENVLFDYMLVCRNYYGKVF